MSLLSIRGLTPIELSETEDLSETSVASSASLSPQTASRHPWWLQLSTRRSGLTARELLSLTQSLAALLNAGLTVDRVLQISSALTPGERPRVLLEQLLGGVRAGRTFSEALQASGQRLPPYYISMVNAGEIGGSLPQTLSRLSELMRKQVETRERVRSALVYPALLACVVVLTLIVLLAFVLPRFESLFAESEAPLPASTQIVLEVGRFMADFWWMLVLGAVAMAATARWWLRSPGGRATFDQWAIRSRITMGLPAAVGTARLLRTLSSLCRSGLPLPSALRIARGTLTNTRLLAALSEITREVQAGGSFALALSGAKVFPEVAAQLARVGEETGRLDEMLLSAATVLEEDSQLRLEKLLTLFVPLLTIGMGILVAGLIGSVLIGLLSINDLAN